MDLILYTKLINQPLVQNTLKLSREPEGYSTVLSALLEKAYELELSGDLMKKYICYLLVIDENPFSLMAEREGTKIDAALKALALQDLKQIISWFQDMPIKISLDEKEDVENFFPIYRLLEEGNALDLLESLIIFYHTYGAGVMNRYTAFKWDKEKKLIGIQKCDPIRLEELVGCDYQKNTLIANTINLLKGKEANNALLFGDSGTGKSSMIKALLNAYHKDGLRLIELSKSDFKDFNLILASVKNRGLKYILFLDDLSFEEFETDYKYMKALIEGGVEIKPNNVLIYATSNRRHLIRETWEERKGEDVHITDTRQEKLSLSDRFGISLTFTSPSQHIYLEMINKLAQSYDIELPENVLREKAIQWELVHGGRSGRVAKQFIQTLL